MSTKKGKGSELNGYAYESFTYVKLSANKLLLRGKPIPYFIKYKTKVFKVIFIYKKKTLLKHINIVICLGIESTVVSLWTQILINWVKRPIPDHS